MIGRRHACLRACLPWIAVCVWLLVTNRAAAAPPNVLIILADDLGHSDLGCYGSRIQTPNLDALASGGIRLTNFYNTARCWPTRAALLTGYYPQQIGFDTLPADESRGMPTLQRGRRPAWATLIPVRLRNAGYRSYHSGKWHLQTRPIQAGFDHSYLLKDQGRFFSPQVHFRDDQKLPAVGRDEGYYGTVAIADHAVESLASHAADHSGDPFFHFLAFTAPHFPLQAMPEDIAKYENVFDDGWDAARDRRMKRLREDGIVAGDLPDIEREVGPPYYFPKQIAEYGKGELTFPVPWDELNAQQQRFQSKKMAIHAAMIDRMDQEIGRVLDQIRQMNAFDNTLILFLSDNGGSAEMMIRADGHDPEAAMGSADTHLCLGPGWSMATNTPFRRHKTWVHEGGCHTPLIAHWPAGIRMDVQPASARTNPSVCHVIDIMPTVLELAGLDATSGVDVLATPIFPGRSFVAALQGETLPPRELWWCHDGHRAVRRGDWKLVAAKDDSWELYNLKNDPTETQNLAGRFPERVVTMAARWTARADTMRTSTGFAN